jgi:hypothetical protein
MEVVLVSSWIAVALIVAVALAAWILRRSSDETVEAPPSPVQDLDDEDALEDEGEVEELAITSEGDVFIPDSHAVRIMPLGEAESLDEHREDIEAGLLALSREDRLHLRSLRGKPGQALQGGDLTAARLQRGAAGVVPWRLETLGRDGDYGFFPFETEDGARAALALLERYRVVRRPLDEDGRPIPASAEDFEEARRRYEESRRALVMDSDPGEGLEPGTYSDRR